MNIRIVIVVKVYKILVFILGAIVGAIRAIAMFELILLKVIYITYVRDGLIKVAIMKTNNISEVTIRINDVVKMTSVSKSTIWRWVKEGSFPQPSKYTDTITVWRYDEVLSWIDERIPPSYKV